MKEQRPIALWGTIPKVTASPIKDHRDEGDLSILLCRAATNQKRHYRMG